MAVRHLNHFLDPALTKPNTSCKGSVWKVKAIYKGESLLRQKYFSVACNDKRTCLRSKQVRIAFTAYQICPNVEF